MSNNSNTVNLTPAQLQDIIKAAIAKLREGVISAPDPEPEPGPKPPTRPNEGETKPGGWGASPDPKNWKAAPMASAKYAGKFKIVDGNGVNVMHLFSSLESAQQMIDYVRSTIGNTPGPTPPPTPPTPPTPGPTPTPTTGEKDQFGILKICPDKAGGKTLTNFEPEYKMRNYASGAPSEWSCEYTADLGGNLSEIEATYYIQIRGFEKKEADTISTKILGPSHQDGSGRSWYITQLMTDGSDQKTFQTEEPHPTNHDNHQPVNFKVGESVIGKWVGIKSITHLINGGKDRRIEMWLDYPVADIANPPNNWRMYWGVDDTGQLDHGHFIQPTGSLVTSRIDGVEKGNEPDFKYASVREITARAAGSGGGGGAGGGGTPPTPPPPPPTPPTPEPSGDNVDKFGVKSIYPSTGKRFYDYLLKPNAGLRHNFDAMPKETMNSEITGYFSINKAPDDEVSGKWSVTTHSDGNHVKCLDIGVDNTSGASRYRYEDPHPDYTGTLATGSKNGVPLGPKFVGYKFIRLTMPDGSVQLEVWQDAGNNEGTTPANQWVQLAKWKVDKQYSVTDYPNGVYGVLRLDGDNIESDLRSKWISYVGVIAPT